MPKILTDDHKTKRMDSAQKLLTRYAQEGEEFLDSIVTRDETRVFHHTPESNQEFDDDDEVQEEIVTWFRRQAADFHDSWIQKLVPGLTKCSDNAGNNVENEVMYRQLIHTVASVT